MNIYQKLAIATAGFTLSFAATAANPVQAITFTEGGDAGQLLNTAQSVGAGFDKIAGTLADKSDVDLYKIFLPNGFFSASTVGGADFDTQLFLFDSFGKGIIFNDDVDSFDAPSTIGTTLSAGYYYLGISGWDVAPVSSLGRIFPDTYRGAPIHNALLGPTGPGGNEPLSGWVEAESDQNGGRYAIALSTSPTASVPEPPITIALAVFSGIGAIAGRRIKSIGA